MSRFYVYGRDNCPWCTRAVELLESKDIEYIYLKLGEDYSKVDLIDKLGYTENVTVPQIFVDDIARVGGYTELLRLLDE